MELTMNKTIGVVSTIAMLAMTVAFFFLPNRPTVGQSTVELGAVRWNRDLEKAKAASTRTGKPLFVQFQEVPG